MFKKITLTFFAIFFVFGLSAGSAYAICSGPDCISFDSHLTAVVDENTDATR